MNRIKTERNGAITELLPCPFCGGQAELCVHNPTGVSWVRCTECEASSGASSRNGAIGLWNTRAERTCSLEPTFTTPVAITSVQEYTCSECGEFAYLYVVSDGEALRFCPNCGRKAVDDD